MVEEWRNIALPFISITLSNYVIWNVKKKKTHPRVAYLFVCLIYPFFRDIGRDGEWMLGSNRRQSWIRLMFSFDQNNYVEIVIGLAQGLPYGEGGKACLNHWQQISRISIPIFYSSNNNWIYTINQWTKKYHMRQLAQHTFTEMRENKARQDESLCVLREMSLDHLDYSSPL